MDKYAVHTPPASSEKTASGAKQGRQPVADPMAQSTDPVRCPVCLTPCTWLGCWHCPTHGTAPFE